MFSGLSSQSVCEARSTSDRCSRSDDLRHCWLEHVPFDRLLRGIEDASIDERSSFSTDFRGPARNAECVDFLGHEEFISLVRGARLTVTHAGAGSIMTALAEGKRPIVVPRRKSFGEAVDDHQLPFARRSARARAGHPCRKCGSPRVGDRPAMCLSASFVEIQSQPDRGRTALVHRGLALDGGRSSQHAKGT